jgi:hypothetical protein
MQFNTDATNKRKARSKAKKLGHDLSNFRQSHSQPQISVAYCQKCYVYAFVEEDDIRGHAVTQPCTRKD